jgi:hypothetical protein
MDIPILGETLTSAQLKAIVGGHKNPDKWAAVQPRLLSPKINKERLNNLLHCWRGSYGLLKHIPLENPLRKFIGNCTVEELHTFLQQNIFKPYIKNNPILLNNSQYNGCCAMHIATMLDHTIECLEKKKHSPVRSLNRYLKETPHLNMKTGLNNRFSGCVLETTLKVYEMYEKSCFTPNGWSFVGSDEDGQNCILIKIMEPPSLLDRHPAKGYDLDVIARKNVEELGLGRHKINRYESNTLQGKVAHTCFSGFGSGTQGHRMTEENLGKRCKPASPLHSLQTIILRNMNNTGQISNNYEAALELGFKPMCKPFLNGMYPRNDKHWIMPMWRRSPDYIEDR